MATILGIKTTASILRRTMIGFSLLAVLPLSIAQDKPSLKILIGFPPGGSADTIARQMAIALKDDYASVVVHNKPGPAGMLAATFEGQVRKAVSLPEMREQLTKLGINPLGHHQQNLLLSKKQT
jgi:hypothetical protein